MTGEKALPVLDAAHIRGVAEGGQHRLDNGLLLRSDVLRLFDSGYVTVTPEGRFRVSRRLEADYDNGEPYSPFDGREHWLPSDPRERPGREFLEWQGGVVFRGYEVDLPDPISSSRQPSTRARPSVPRRPEPAE